MTTRLLTPRQADLLACLDECAAQGQRPPTLREMAAMMGITLNAAFGHMKHLLRKGFVATEPSFNDHNRSARSWRVVRRRDGGMVLIRGLWVRADSFTVGKVPHRWLFAEEVTA